MSEDNIETQTDELPAISTHHNAAAPFAAATGVSPPLEEYQQIDHSSSISKDLSLFLTHDGLTDYTLVVTSSRNHDERETFRVHKVILAARCPFFFK